MHLAVRGTITRTELRAVLAATYHQVWWPPTDMVRFDGDRLPVWDEPSGPTSTRSPPPGGRAEQRPSDVAKTLRWLESASVPAAALEDQDLVERALTAIALRLDGKAAAATVARRKRAVFYNVLDTAATGKRRLLARNPLASMRWKAPEVGGKVGRRAVINPRQARVGRPG